MTKFHTAALAAIATLMAGSALAEPQPMANPAAGAEPIVGDATYKAFHEKEGISRIMADFVPRITTDPRIKARFEGVNLIRLQLMLTNQVCYLTGGPCEYGGRDMKEVHASLGLTNLDFNALAEDLQLSMDKEGVPFTAQNQLVAKLAPMQRVIVTK
ncbi:group I truncated hemoglobin [Phenylobacterium aquaticum]|uniref:group I truncated hemoglobin n=1 Tax=Phenylobacterium aquaticum TaxID=1763816 RepID=UPI001F5C5FF9|nr:group 1 truncated hemoglobin [Phenylobacterium aquaticum]MCI3131048.1 group 1 truncated hemoglobin [Phenylobacterium aquaticum]